MKPFDDRSTLSFRRILRLDTFWEELVVQVAIYAPTHPEELGIPACHMHASLPCNALPDIGRDRVSLVSYRIRHS